MRTIKAIEEKYLDRAADFVRKVFTESEDAESGGLDGITGQVRYDLDYETLR